jgi:peptidoglycan/xylan/chitin deacetylase (PgdA/CDA1 family)
MGTLMQAQSVVGSLTRFTYKAFANAGGHRLVWAFDHHRLRILSYHGICEDYLAREAWMPQYFVKKSAFESQLSYLQRYAHVLPLTEAIERMKAGTLPSRAVSLTFDDGYANNLLLAYPLLRQYGMSATIFVSSGYTESGDLFPFLKLRLIHLNARHLPSGMRAATPADYKSNPMDSVLQSLEPPWAAIKSRLTGDQWSALRPLTASEIKTACVFFDFGAHTHTHCILRNENEKRRRDEIQTSIRKVSEWTGQPVRLFSYPNGERGDYNETDKQTLREAGVEAAVTGIAGANRQGAEMLELRRYPVGIGHDPSAFRVEVTGFRSAVRSVTGRVPA